MADITRRRTCAGHGRPGRVLLLCAGISVAAWACGDDKSPTSPSGGGRAVGPTVTAISPASGTTFGGTMVTISGTKFAAGMTVSIGGAAATDVTVQSPTSLTARTAQHAAGQADVVVALSGVSGTLRNGFTYTAPAAQTNASPTIASFKALGTRRDEPQNFADLGETINVTAYVADAETPIDQLTYAWNAPGGTFSGNGPAVQWTAPGGDPKDYTLTLTITERYQSADSSGLPVTKENTTTGAVTVSVHDSAHEVGDMARDFLVDFSRQLPADQVLRNFTQSCGGTSDERGDIEGNQQSRKIERYTVDAPRVDIDFGSVCRDPRGGGDACADVHVVWHSLILADGSHELTDGTDQVSAVYEGSRWRLCSSVFNGTRTSEAGVTRATRVVPGAPMR